MPPLITLTTDFGMRDPYVAAMKGVLASRCPGAAVVDLSHDIAPHDVLGGALFLAASLPYFPSGTVHVAVVDPGVGSDRPEIAARWQEQYLVMPDNGLATLLWRECPPDAVHTITTASPPGSEVSPTFHGRDIFAPAAAALASGTPLEGLGPAAAAPVELHFPHPRFEGTRVHGAVVHIDHFGNATTNIPRSLLPAGAVRVSAAGRDIGPVRRTYADVSPGEPLALIGSSGYLEIAVNQVSAAAQLGLERGTEVTVARADSPG